MIMMIMKQNDNDDHEPDNMMIMNQMLMIMIMNQILIMMIMNQMLMIIIMDL